MRSHEPGARHVLEVRLHGRGGQGGVTCAKILAAVWARLGKSVQSFGDYAGERAGAPIRAYTRVADEPITDRNKVYRPDHLLVLDPTLLTADVVTGLAGGGTLLVNTKEAPEAIAARFPGFRVAMVDATEIARRHGIGTRSVVIVNTTIAGAFARAMDLPLEALEATYAGLGFASNFRAAREAYDEVRFVAPAPAAAVAGAGAAPARLPDVLPLVEHREGAPLPVHTGNWRTQTPRYVRGLAPCNAICPAGNDVVGFLHAAAHGDDAGASAILGRTTPFAAVCGRVCDAPCEQNCNRIQIDGAVRVRAVERLVADRFPVAVSVAAASPKRKRVAVVGGGPMGLSAAYTLARLGHEATIIEGEPALGGLLRTAFPADVLPRDVVDREIEAILRLGVHPRLGRFLSPEEIAALAREFDAVVVAHGTAPEPRSVAASIGEGRRAAIAALASAGVAVSVPKRPDPADAVRPEDIRQDHFAHVPPGLDDASEAKRCLSCGKCTQCDTCLVYCPEGVIHRRGNGYFVDVQDCKGCGVCVAVCPRCAMEMAS